MEPISRTTTELLDGLVDPENAPIWERFDRRYRPLLFAVAHRLGLGDADAADVAQDVLATFVREFRDGRYDRSRGRLRQWLLAFLRARVIDRHRRRARRGADAALPSELPDERSVTDAWERERRMLLLRSALDELRSTSRTDPRTIGVFELLYMHGMSPTAAAGELGLTVEEIYVARSRVAGRIRAIVKRLDDCWDD